MSPTTADAGQTAQRGPVVDREMLLEIILPVIDRIGVGAFARRAGIDPSGLAHFLRGTDGRKRARLDYADKMLTVGMGRPDLVELVCPLGVESLVGEASSRRGRTPREVA